MPLKLLLIARYEARSLRRLAAQHAFLLFVLGPLIVVGGGFVAQPALERMGSWLEAGTRPLGGGAIRSAGLLAAAALTAATLPGALREAFALGTPRAALEPLPVARWTLLHAALGAQLLRAAPAAVAAGAALAVAGAPLGDAAAVAAATLPQLMLLSVGAALALARWDGLRSGRLAVGAAAVAAFAVAAAWFPVAALPLAPLAPLAALIGGGLGDAWNQPSGWPPLLFGLVGQVGGLGLLYAGVLGLARIRRSDDRERLRLALERRRSAFNRLTRLIARRAGRPTAALVVRDLRLTLRGFSPAVAAAAWAAVAALAAGLWAAYQPGFPEAWKAEVVLLGEALACLCVAALAPLLLSFQLPYWWVERAAGASPDDIWRAKAIYAAAVTLPVALIGFLAAAAIAPAEAPQLAGRSLLIWATVGPLFGALSFDVAASPVLGIFLGIVFGLALCGFLIIGAFWPLGLLLYAYVMPHIIEHAETAAARLGVAG